MNLKPKSILTYLSIFIPLFLGFSKLLFSLKISLSEFLITCTISLIVNVLIHVDNLKSHLDGLASHFDDLRNFIQKGMPLIDLAEKTNLTDDLVKLIRCYETVVHYNNEFLTEHLRDIFSNHKYEIDKVAKGQIEITEEAFHTHFVIKIAENTNNSLDATVLWAEDDLLKKRRGIEYDDTLKLALKKKEDFCVRRIYIFDDDSDLKSEKVISRMNKDMNAGVKVKWCLAGKWEGMGGRNEPVDFGIFDNKNLWVYGRKNRDGFRTATIFTDKIKIEKYQRMFRANWASANDYEVVEKRSKEVK